MEQVQINPEGENPSNGEAQQEQEQKALAAVDQKNAELDTLQNPQPKTGEKILGKFESQADLEKAYQELEKRLSSKEPVQEPTKEEDKANAAMDEDKAIELLNKADVDVDQIANHYYANGGLSKEHYEALEKAGIPKGYVDQYLSGIEAEGEQMRAELFEEVGGEESFQAMSQWAMETLSEKELAAYNESIDSGDFNSVRSAVMSLAYRFEKSMGKDPKLVTGNGKVSAGDRFESVAQLTAAMKDPRYTTDAAYRQEVEAKLSRSSIL